MSSLTWDMFALFMKVSAVSFGGGASAIPLMQRELVGGALLTPQQFTEALAVSTSLPGIVIFNMAVFVSYKLGGSAVTAAAAVTGAVLPTLFLMGLCTYLLTKYQNMKALPAMLGAIQPLMVALLAVTVVGIVPISLRSGHHWALFAGTIVLMAKFNVHPVWVFLGAGALGALVPLD